MQPAGDLHIALTHSALVEFARQQLSIMTRQLRIGLFQLQQYAGFTGYGQAIMDDMSACVAGIEEKTDKVNKTVFDTSTMTKFFSDEGNLELYMSEMTGRPLMAVDYVKEHVSLYAPAQQHKNIFVEMGWEQTRPS